MLLPTYIFSFLNVNWYENSLRIHASVGTILIIITIKTQYSQYPLVRQYVEQVSDYIRKFAAYKCVWCWCSTSRTLLKRTFTVSFFHVCNLLCHRIENGRRIYACIQWNVCVLLELACLASVLDFFCSVDVHNLCFFGPGGVTGKLVSHRWAPHAFTARKGEFATKWKRDDEGRRRKAEAGEWEETTNKYTRATQVTQFMSQRTYETYTS